MTRYEHSLQSATRALRDGRDEEYVVMALLHDIGDELAPHTHSEMTGAVLRPFVRPELVWIASHHGAFQLYYYGHHYGIDRNIRDRWAGLLGAERVAAGQQAAARVDRLGAVAGGMTGRG